MSPLSQSILKTLFYFDIFRHPLSAEEIHINCHNHSASLKEVQESLNYLVGSKFINCNNQLYFIGQDASVTERRIRGKRSSLKMMKVAQVISGIISFFPFVEAVCISGSLSKGYFDKDSDIDFFVITTPNRLWLCRTLLILFKKIFLFNSKKYFCINYFISSDNLHIPDQNIFTATEISFLASCYNSQLYRDFITANRWITTYYPNKSFDVFTPKPAGKRFLKKAGETIFKGKVGEALDTLCFNYTLRRWEKKFAHFNREEFNLNLRSGKHVSKHHPRGFQYRVLEEFQKKISSFETEYNVTLKS